jgi:orotidine-5'-phosphate decarboxylase
VNFSDKLRSAWEASGADLCVGLDPIIERMPPAIAASPRPVLAFNRFVVDIVGDLVCAFKPQFAHHAAMGAEADLAETIAYIHERFPKVVVILDGKRGDIGSTAEMYAREAFDRYDADAVTVNPYMGDDAVLPFLQRPDRAALVLCRNSNPSSALVQTAVIEGRPLYEVIARRAEQSWNRLGNVMLVVGATYPDDLARVRAAAPTVPFLVPGIGEQGGSPRAVVLAGQRKDGWGLVVSASRSVLYAGSEAQVRRAAEEIHRELSDARASSPPLSGEGDPEGVEGASERPLAP